MELQPCATRLAAMNTTLAQRPAPIGVSPLGGVLRALRLEGLRAQWSPTSIASPSWLSLVNSIGAMSRAVNATCPRSA